MGAILIGLAFFMVYLSKEEVAAYYHILVLIIGLLVMLTFGYVWIQSMMDNYNPGYDELLIRLLGIVEGYEEHIWFTILSKDINYSIISATIKTYAAAGGLLGVFKGIIGFVKK